MAQQDQATDEQRAEQRLREYVAARERWTHVVIDGGWHVVRDQAGVLRARHRDPRIALEILERQ